MKLADLLTADALSDARLAALEVRGVSADSRSIKPGDLFVAVAGAKADGLDFLPQALAACRRRSRGTPHQHRLRFIGSDHRASDGDPVEILR